MLLLDAKANAETVATLGLAEAIHWCKQQSARSSINPEVVRDSVQTMIDTYLAHRLDGVYHVHAVAKVLDQYKCDAVTTGVFRTCMSNAQKIWQVMEPEMLMASVISDPDSYEEIRKLYRQRRSGRPIGR